MPWLLWCLCMLMLCDAVCLSMICTDDYACGMSDVYRLNSIGEGTPPWGTLVLNWRVGFRMLCKLCVTQYNVQ